MVLPWVHLFSRTLPYLRSLANGSNTLINWQAKGTKVWAVEDFNHIFECCVSDWVDLDLGTERPEFASCDFFQIEVDFLPIVV